FLEQTDSAIPALDARLRVFVGEYLRHKHAVGRPLRVLDVGCGRHAVLARHVAAEDAYWGCDFPSSIEAEIANYVAVDLNEDSLREAVGADFDVVFCGEVIEHLFNPDALLDEVRELVRPDGIVVLSTPNLGYWANRLLLLAGISPLFLENSA